MASGFDDSLLSFIRRDAEDLDGLRAVLASMLLDHTDIDIDSIYSLLFESGSRITWH
jgi:hypothetical protein